MYSTIRCYECGKTINDNEIVMKDVNIGFLMFQTARKPFHVKCWRKYYGRTRKEQLPLVSIIIVLPISIVVIYLLIRFVFPI